MRHRAGLWALAGLTLLALGGWTTNKSSGSRAEVFAYATTGRVIPDSANAGLTFISIADLAGTGEATVTIYGEDWIGGSTTVTLNGGAAFEANCQRGIDSVRVVTNATKLGFHVSN